MRHRLRPALVAAALLACSGAAQAQWSGSLRLESDHRFRGVSLSGERPAWRLGVAYDHASGAYAGASLAQVRLQPGRRSAQLLAYGGLARRSSDLLAWELGATTVHYSGEAGHGYIEVYAGLIGERWTLRLHHAPDYFGRGVRTLYAEANGGAPLSAPWRWFAHVGALRDLDRPAADNERRWRADARIGLGFEGPGFELQAAWVGVQRQGPDAGAYAAAPEPAPRRGAWVLGAAFFF